MRAQAEKDPHKEICGILLGPKDEKNKITQIIPCRNVQDEYHKKDPLSFPRDATQAYFIDSRDLLRIQKQAREEGNEIRAIYHSHINAGAYFSEEDQRIALSEGKPTYPGVIYPVISVRDGKVQEITIHYWDEEKKTFERI